MPLSSRLKKALKTDPLTDPEEFHELRNLAVAKIAVLYDELDEKTLDVEDD